MMGMFDVFESLGKAVVNVAVTPVTAIADVVTLGGALTDREEPYTATAIKAAMKNVMDTTKE